MSSFKNIISIFPVQEEPYFFPIEGNLIGIILNRGLAWLQSFQQPEDHKQLVIIINLRATPIQQIEV